MGALKAVDAAVIEFMRRYSMLILRVALGIVFLWFGALKIFDVSPVEGMVARTATVLPPRAAVLSAGIVEAVIGAGLLTGIAIRLTLVLFFAQMLGTLASAIVMPEAVYNHGNPLILSDAGEFLLKNLVLIAAGLAIVAALPKVSERGGADAAAAPPEPGNRAALEARDPKLGSPPQGHPAGGGREFTGVGRSGAPVAGARAPEPAGRATSAAGTAVPAGGWGAPVAGAGASEPTGGPANGATVESADPEPPQWGAPTNA